MNAPGSPHLHPPELKTDWTAVLAAALCGVAVASNVGKVPIAMALLREEFGLSLVTAGWVASMFNTLAVVSGLFFGLLVDRVGALRMCLIGLTIGIAGGIGGVLATSPTALLLSRFCEGASFVGVAVSAPALLSAAAQPRDRRFALGIWSSYLPAGVGLAMLTAPLLLPSFGWRGLWIGTQVLLALAALAIYARRAGYGLAHPAQRASGSLLATAQEALAQPLPWLLALTFATWTVQHFALIIWLPTFLKEQRQLAPGLIALLSCLMVLVNVPGNLLGGALIQRDFRRGNLIVAANLLTGLAGIGIFLDAVPDLLRYGFCLLLSFSGGLIPSAVLSSTDALARSSRQIGTLQGLYMQGGQLGQFAGIPAIAGVVAWSGDWQWALAVTAAAALGGIALGCCIRRLERREEA